jgi:putative PIN family toxin of toxin-antitoxin system
MNLRVVLDTNVILSGFLLPESNPGKILRLAAEGRFVLVLSPDILAEVERVFLKKFRYSAADAAKAKASLELIGELVSPTSLIELISKDPSDNRILECALDGLADVIVSGDKKHLLSLGTFRQRPLLSPADFLRTYFS